jgi:hypothetical protein
MTQADFADSTLCLAQIIYMPQAASVALQVSASGGGTKEHALLSIMQHPLILM